MNPLYGPGPLYDSYDPSLSGMQMTQYVGPKQSNPWLAGASALLDFFGKKKEKKETPSRLGAALSAVRNPPRPPSFGPDPETGKVSAYYEAMHRRLSRGR